MNDGTQQLPDSSRRALLRIADILRGGHSGRIVLDCHEGGVREVEEVRRWKPQANGGQRRRESA